MAKRPPPLVTGLSPKEGLPGTLITIRGENLGVNSKDLIGLTICGSDCLMTAKWESPSKIVARVVGRAKSGQGEVVVTTASGRQGSSTVTFRLLEMDVGPLQESAVWVDESDTIPLRQAGAVTITSMLSPVDTDDPLGIDARREKFTVNPDLYPEGAHGILKFEGFNPAWYILENYQRASLEELKLGLSHMKSQSNTIQQGPKDSVKTNLSCYMSCLDALSKFNDQWVSNHASGASTDQLTNQVTQCRDRASGIFTNVLKRKEQADAIRSTLSILQRFKFLFYLPRSITENLQKGDYTTILVDYNRANSYLKDHTEVPLFKETFAEVQARMDDVRSSMTTKLLTFPAKLEEQKKMIGYLMQLEPGSDPAWECICQYHTWLTDLVWATQAKYLRLAQMEALSKDTDSDNEDHLLMRETPRRFDFVESICGTLQNRLLSFWKLAQTYVAGGHIKPAAPQPEKSQKIEQMLLSYLQLCTWLILNAVVPDAVPDEATRLYKDRFVKWPVDSTDDTVHLIQSLKSLRKCIVVLQQQEYADRLLLTLHQTCRTVRLRCLGRLIQTTTENVHELHSKENGKILKTTNEYSKTQLPDLFESLIVDILPFLRQVVSSGYAGEVDLFAIDKVRVSLIDSFHNLLCAFKETLERLSRIPKVDNGTPQRPSNLNIGAKADMNGTLEREYRIKDNKLLVVLGNCDYCLKVLIPNLLERLKNAGIRHTEQISEPVMASYRSLYDVLLQAYAAAKCSALQELIDPISYSLTESPSRVSNFIKDIVLCIVAVRAELFLIAPHFAQEVMNLVVKECVQRADAKFRTFRNTNASEEIQIVIDLKALKLSLLEYLGSVELKLLDQNIAIRNRAASESVVDECLAGYRKAMRLTLLSLEGKSASA